MWTSRIERWRCSQRFFDSDSDSEATCTGMITGMHLHLPHMFVKWHHMTAMVWYGTGMIWYDMIWYGTKLKFKQLQDGYHMGCPKQIRFIPVVRRAEAAEYNTVLFGMTSMWQQWVGIPPSTRNKMPWGKTDIRILSSYRIVLNQPAPFRPNTNNMIPPANALALWHSQ